MGGQFSTRVITLMPVAIAINIVLGVTVQQVLKLPIYLDSIGTILVGVLAGPIAGALTGVLSNLIWQYAPGIGGSTIGPFAITAGVIGLLAGVWGRYGVYRSRPASGTQLIVAAVVGAAMVVLIVLPIVNNPAYTNPDIGGYPEWVFTAAIIIGAIAAIVVGAFIYLRRDLAGLWVAVAGVVTGDRRSVRVGADRGDRLWRRDRVRRRSHRGCAPTGWRRRLPGVAWTGTLQRSDRQDHHELRGVRHPGQSVLTRGRQVPEWRAT